MEYEYDQEESVTTALHRATSSCTACESCEFDPLYSVVDPDALETLFSEGGEAGPGTDRWLSFSLDPCLVTLGSERVEIEPLTTSVESGICKASDD